jgi:hypothetical protein
MDAKEEVGDEPDYAAAGGGSTDDPWKLLGKRVLHG